MTHKQEYIVSKCIEANPSIQYSENLCTECDGSKCNGIRVHSREPRLADVLLAIDKVDSGYSISAWGGFEKWTNVSDTNDTFTLTNHPKIKWNLTNDSLSSQSEETIDFLYQLLS